MKCARAETALASQRPDVAKQLLMDATALAGPAGDEPDSEIGQWTKRLLAEPGVRATAS